MKTENLLIKVFLLTLFIFLSCNVYSSNISVSNVSLTGQVVGTQYTMIQFDISWENSWRTTSAPNNWDAAWIFIKYRVGTGDWQHAWLNNTGHVNPAGSTITTGLLDPASAFNAITNPGLGVFIYRDADGLGTFSKTSVKLRWNYGANGVADGGSVNIKVFAVEMAYVPQGSFYAGSGGTELCAFYKYPTTTNPYQITSEVQITVGTATDNLYYPRISTCGGDQLGPVPAAFPKGYNAFYCMKYEIMQQQYVDFLNSLNYTQQTTRSVNSPSSSAGTGALITGNLNRNGIDIMTPGVSSTTPAVYACNLNGNTTYSEADDGQCIACNILGWGDIAAYLDWSGLRPMSELEFEKACRGTIAPVPNEYAWGTAIVSNGQYTISNSGANNESINTNYSTTNGNSSNFTTVRQAGVIDGPLRVGIFAGNIANTGRVTSGATYYGIMEMSGNLWELTITLGESPGRTYTGTHGNGLLDANGMASSDIHWPGTDAVGTGWRGGRWADVDYTSQTSCRWNATNVYTFREYSFGGRGVRTSP
jgi:formylglycine-generating enzyme required for sulfatase activity